MIYGGHVIVDGGLQIDGSQIGCINSEQVSKACDQFQEAGVRNIVVCGIYSPIDSSYKQENLCREIILESYKSANVFCSADCKMSQDMSSEEGGTDVAIVGRIGILERENAAILNATLHIYAKFIFSKIKCAIHSCGLPNCPVFISTNDGSMLPVAEAAQFPIQCVASGPANSMLGASYLGLEKFEPADGSSSAPPENSEKIMILDIGGTTTDTGALMANGFPRQASAYSSIVGVQVNFSMPDVSTVGLGGGSIVKTDAEGNVVSIGPESVGNELTTKSLCFGGNALTTTDVAVAAGLASNVGTHPVTLKPSTIVSAQEMIKEKVQDIILNAKTQAKHLPVAFVGGGAIICQHSLFGSDNNIKTSLASVANAVGAAYSQLSATVDTIFEIGVSSSREQEAELIELATESATKKCVSYGAIRETLRVAERQVVEMPYVTGKIRVTIKVVGEFEGGNAIDNKSLDNSVSHQTTPEEVPSPPDERRTPISYDIQPSLITSLNAGSNLLNYHPNVTNGAWKLTEIDIEWLAVGCYILGCGGGGSPHLPSIAAKQLLRQGETLSIVDARDLAPSAILPPIGCLGSPMVSIERPGGNLCSDALANLLAHLDLDDYDAGLCVEIGGSNGLSPLLSGGRGRDVRPMVDGDLMGRAFPTYEMITPYLYHEDINYLLPASLASGTGTGMVLQTAQNTEAVDSILRACCVTMGCAAGVASRPLSAKDFIEQGLLYTHSAAWRIGRAVKTWQMASGTGAESPAAAIVEQCGGSDSAKMLFEGKVAGVTNRLVKGHSVGQLLVEGYSPLIERAGNSVREAPTSASGRSKVLQQLCISFKNENLIAELFLPDKGGTEVCLKKKILSPYCIIQLFHCPKTKH